MNNHSDVLTCGIILRYTLPRERREVISSTHLQRRHIFYYPSPSPHHQQKAFKIWVCQAPESPQSHQFSRKSSTSKPKQGALHNLTTFAHSSKCKVIRIGFSHNHIFIRLVTFAHRYCIWLYTASCTCLLSWIKPMPSTPAGGKLLGKAPVRQWLDSRAWAENSWRQSTRKMLSEYKEVFDDSVLERPKKVLWRMWQQDWIFSIM